VTSRSIRLRLAAIAGFLAMLFAGLTGRAIQLTVIEGEQLRQVADRQHRQRVAVPPKRGSIVDRYGEPLALAVESAAVYMRPRELAARPETISAVAHLLGLPPDVVLAKAASPAPFVWLNRQVPLDQWTALEDLGLSGIGSEPARLRLYPQGALAGHVLGFVGIDGQGLEGIERTLDADLRGEVDALDVERDARGRRMAVDGQWWPLPRVGARVELTIDAEIQRVAEAELTAAVEQFNAVGGSAVVLDPRTGEVLALTNTPRFDPNAFANASPDEWRNRAITDAYEPGSTFKAILAAAALDAHVVRPTEPIYCERGQYAVGGRVIHDHQPYGTLTFTEVIEHSSNIGSAKVAQRLGRERLAAMIAAFGFGQPTGIDLPGEAAGIVRPVRSWRPIDLTTAAFGHGLAVTPLQLARAFGAIANGGLLMRPYVVRAVFGEDGQRLHETVPTVERRVLAPETAEALTTMLRGVVEHGTGKLAQIDGFAVAGKTGTAQKVNTVSGGYSSKARMSSFVGFVPADDPRFVVFVLLDSPRTATYGGTVAAPAFRRIAEYALNRMAVLPHANPVPPRWDGPPLLQAAALQLPVGTLPTGGIPSFLGLSMRDALVLAQKGGWEAHIEGSGYVVSQDPPAGLPVDDRDVRLRFGSRN